MRLLLYSVLRVMLLLAALVLLYVLGVRSWLLWILAIVVAALLSYVLLPNQRQLAAAQVADTVRRRRPRAQRVDEDAAYEDSLLAGDHGSSAAAGRAPAPGAGSVRTSGDREPGAGDQDPRADDREPGTRADEDGPGARGR